MTEQISDDVRDAMVAAVTEVLRKMDINAHSIEKGEKRTLATVDFGHVESTATNHKMDFIWYDNNMLLIGMVGVLDLGPKGALMNRTRTMVNWFDDKEEKTIEDIFPLQMLGQQFLKATQTANDFIWTAIQTTNCLRFSKVACGTDGDVYVTTHMGFDGSIDAEMLEQYMTHVFSHTSWIMRIHSMIVEYVLPEKPATLSVGEVLEERFSKEEETDNKCPPEKDEGSDETKDDEMRL